MWKAHWLGAIGLAALAGVAGCESVASRCVSIGSCFDPEFPWDLDAAVDASGADAGAALDAGAVGAEPTVDANLDGVPIDAGPALSISQFCDAQFATARAFSDNACHCVGADVDGLNYVREVVLRYSGSAACIDAVERIVAKTSYDPRQASACAARFDAQFALPTGVSSCAPEGFDVGLARVDGGQGRAGAGAAASAEQPSSAASSAMHAARARSSVSAACAVYRCPVRRSMPAVQRPAPVSQLERRTRSARRARTAAMA